MGNELVLLTGLNFNELNKSIEVLGERNRALTDKEKEIGVNLLSEWQGNVLDKISNKREEVDKIRRLLADGDAHCYDEGERKKAREKLAEVSGTQKLYKALTALEDTLKEYDLTSPQRPNVNPDKTITQNDLEYADYEKEARKWSIERAKIEYSKGQAYKKFIVAAKKSSSVKKLVRQINDYLLNLKKYEAEAKDKAHLAKVNLSISDEKVREAIQEIINFTKSIN